VADRIREHGHSVLLIDVDTLGPATLEAQVSREAVAREAGADLAAVVARRDRGEAVALMTRAAPLVLARLQREGRIDGVISLGGGGGTAICTSAMRALPVGFPKLMVSTLASGNTAPYVGVKDIVMMPSVVDVAGLNRLSRKLLAQAAALETQAAQKRLEASKAPSAQAMKLIEAAAALTTQAIDLRRNAGAAALVATTAGPEAARNQRQAEAMREQQKRLESDKDAVAAVDAARSKAADALGGAANTAMSRATEAADQLEKVSAELKTLFASAAESLDQAASLAQQGSSLPGPQGSSAKMGAASAHLAQAMLHERWAMGASMEAYAFDAMARAGGDAKWSKLASDARQERADAGAKALAALEAADGDISSDSGASLNALKARITEAKKAYEGPKPAQAADAAKSAEAETPKPAEGEAPKAAEGEAEKPADAPAAEPKPDAPADQPPAEPAPAPGA